MPASDIRFRKMNIPGVDVFFVGSWGEVWVARIRARPSGVRGPVDLPAVHPAAMVVLHRGRPARSPAPRPRPAAGAGLRQGTGRMRQLVGRRGSSGISGAPPSPAGCDISDNGLPSWMDVNVLDADNLLPTFTAPAVQRREQLDEGA